MRRKAKREWTDEQRAAAAERMKVAQAARMANIERARTEGGAVAVQDPAKVVAPEMAMDPIRRAKLAMLQAQRLATPEGQAALARHEAEKAVAVVSVNPTGDTGLAPSRIGSRDVRLIVRTDGTMVSCDGPCVCGAAKRQWHAICLKESGNG